MEHTIDPDGAPLELTAENGYAIFSPANTPAAQTEKQWASSIDTEGELPAGGKVGNTQITRRIRIVGQGASAEEIEASFYAAQAAFEQKLHKLDTEGGVLRLTYPGGRVIDWKVRAISGGERLIDNRFLHHSRTEDTVTFVCAPFGVGVEKEVGVFTTAPGGEAVIGTVSVGGSAPALGRAVVEDLDAKTTRWLRWGRESRNYSDAATALMEYAAADLTPASGATVAGGEIVHDSLISRWQKVLSTEIDGVGHMTHVGVFELYAVVTAGAGNSGAVSVRLEWAVGGAPRTTNIEVSLDGREGAEVLVSLGQILARPGSRGEHMWHGWVSAKTDSSGDEIAIRKLLPIPVGEGHGMLAAGASEGDALEEFVAHDDFVQPSGALTGKALPSGQAWTVMVGSDPTDFQVDGNGTLERTAASDGTDLADGRWVTAGTDDHGVIVAELSAMLMGGHGDTGEWAGGVVARGAEAAGEVSYVRAEMIADVNNGSLAGFGYRLVIVHNDLLVHQEQMIFDTSSPPGTDGPLIDGRLRLAVEADGTWTVSVAPWGTQTSFGAPFMSGQYSELAAGGSMAEGTVGIYDQWTGAEAIPRLYGDFAAYTVERDAVIHPGRAMELRHDGAERENSDGAGWQQVAVRRHDYLLLDPAGAENRDNRLLFLPALQDPDIAPFESGNLRLTVYATPRYRTVPSG